MTMPDGRIPHGAREITTGQANRVWYIDGPEPYVLKHYSDPARAANEAEALTLLNRYQTPAPRLLGAAPEARPAWTAQTAVHAEPVPASQLLKALAEPLTTIHRIPGPHVGRLAGARHHHRWRDYLHDRLDTYAAAAPDLVRTAAALHHELDTLDDNIQPRLLHHDLQPGHLVRSHTGKPLLLDWELAAFGDPLSDLARLAVRLGLPDPADTLHLAHQPGPAANRRVHLYWRIHLLADAALSTDPVVRHRGRTQLSQQQVPMRSHVTNRREATRPQLDGTPW